MLIVLFIILLIVLVLMFIYSLTTKSQSKAPAPIRYYMPKYIGIGIRDGPSMRQGFDPNVRGIKDLRSLALKFKGTKTKYVYIVADFKYKMFIAKPWKYGTLPPLPNRNPTVYTIGGIKYTTEKFPVPPENRDFRHYATIYQVNA